MSLDDDPPFFTGKIKHSSQLIHFQLFRTAAGASFGEAASIATYNTELPFSFISGVLILSNSSSKIARKDGGNNTTILKGVIQFKLFQ